MNVNMIKLVAIILVLTAGIRNGFSQPYSQNVIGYYSYFFMTGSNLISNPIQIDMQIGSEMGSNHLSQIFFWPQSPGSTAPEGTTVSLWNPTTLSFDTSSTLSNGVWSDDLILPPGTGALVVTPSPFTNTVAGIAFSHDGIYLTNGPLKLPNVFLGPNGIYLFGDACPTPDNGTNIFLNILGRMPFVGEQVTQISGANTSTSTYLGNGQWDAVPTLAVGHAAFFNIKSEPPPELTIIHANNQTVVSWPPTVSPWTLQTNTDPAKGVWGNYAGTFVNNTVTNPPPMGNLFFRLSYP